MHFSELYTEICNFYLLVIDWKVIETVCWLTLELYQRGDRGEEKQSIQWHLGASASF